MDTKYAAAAVVAKENISIVLVATMATSAQTRSISVRSPARIKEPRETMRERMARLAQRRAKQEANEALEERTEERRSASLESKRSVEKKPVGISASTRAGASLRSNTDTPPAALSKTGPIYTRPIGEWSSLITLRNEYFQIWVSEVLDLINLDLTDRTGLSVFCRQNYSW